MTDISDEEWKRLKKIADNIRGEYCIHASCPKCKHEFMCCSDCGLQECEC